MSNQIEGYRLSPQQRHVWSLQQDSNAYRSQCALSMNGSLDKAALKLALSRVSDIHEILRTTFHQQAGATQPFQVIAQSTEPSRDELDLSGMNPADQDARIASLLQLSEQVAFDFQTTPLLKTCLVALSARQHLLLMTLPSICGDSLTLRNLGRAISRQYEAYLEGSRIEDEPMQYADIAEWENQLLESEESEIGKAYWNKKNGAYSPSLHFGSEKQERGKAGFDPRHITLEINAGVLASIESLAQRREVSASDFLLACWQVLLWRRTGDPDVVVGASFDGRKYEELEEVVGPLVRYLPIHCRLRSDSRFGEVLSQVKESTNGAYQWQEYFDSNDSHSSPAETPGAGFFSYSFEFEKRAEEYRVGSITFSLRHLYACSDRFEVKLRCENRNDCLATEWHYDPSLMSDEDIRRIAEQYETLIHSVIEHPDARISELEILTDIRRRELLEKFNSPVDSDTRNKTFHELFEDQVRRGPDHTAILFNAESLSYGELNAKANQLAHYLIGLGVGQESFVGIYAERSVKMVVALLATLKAGAAYVPLDPSYPKDRLDFMLKDSQARVVLTVERLRGSLSETQARPVFLDSDWPQIDQQSTEQPSTPTSPDSLAYVIYTSGSTGTPKGVMIPHSGLVNYLTWCAKAYEVAAGEGSVVHSPIGFDLTITSVFSPLIVGQAVRLLEDGAGIEGLGAVMQSACEYSLIKITPAHLEALSQFLGEAPGAGGTRALVIGGEALFAETLSYWRRLLPATRLINEYGPTETVVGCCVYEVSHDDSVTGPVPIGKPVANSLIYVLDDRLQPVPIGVSGQIYISGAGLARGYLNKADLTAERFLPNPHSTQPGSRMYQTGDLARYRSDGNIEFQGRIDNQVKIRGYRVELGEIESVLAEHPAIRENVVIATPEAAGEKRLIAYITAVGALPAIGEMRDFLKQKLPEYMIPSAFVAIEAMPLTPNGKVDRSALPAQAHAGMGARETFVGPRDTLELQMLEIWQDLLKLERIGVTENFFDIGGNSLLAVQMMAQVHKLFGQDLPLAVLFEHGSIEQLAGILRQQKGATLWSPLVEIQPKGSKRPIFFVHPSGGGVLGFIHLSRRLGKDQPVYGLQSPGLYGEKPCARIEEMAAQYIDSIRLAQSEGPYILGGWSMGGVIAFEMAQQLEKAGEDIALLALLDTKAPIFKGRHEELEETEMLAELAENLARFYGKHILGLYDDLQILDSDERVSYVLEQLKKANVVSSGTGIMHLKRFVEVYCSNTRATLKYAPQVYKHKITLFRAEEIEPEEYQRNPIWSDPTLGWDKFSYEPIKVYRVPGTHEEMIFEPGVQRLAEHLIECLDDIN